jgi:cytochrome c-type protein NapB
MAIEPAFRQRRATGTRTTFRFRHIPAHPAYPHASARMSFAPACAHRATNGAVTPAPAAYVPVTPHPDLGICLQCHVGDDGVMGLASAAADPNSRCPLCHGPTGGAPRPEASANWPMSVWPTLPPRIEGQWPPPIPHDLQLRGNCLACHGGPAAVAELRTSHPERVNCRQCHVAVDPEADGFTRRPWDGELAAGGAR